MEEMESNTGGERKNWWRSRCILSQAFHGETQPANPGSGDRGTFIKKQKTKKRPGRHKVKQASESPARNRLRPWSVSSDHARVTISWLQTRTLLE
ncbi:hypothetical protein RRG08_007065 [Elysia crispata]|uniref:Uncharacterized protein n=1 Tax=Elysia crispata TaxID=231223 RepID=A0AAE0YXZ7_9GAST|nr:hypothetical protein RRG08_007065 [Elysia crispata]